MKKKIMSHLITFLIGGLVFGSIGVVVAINYKASDITYTPTDNTWNVDNAKAAIDDLKTKVKPEYTGLTTITPNTNSQTLYTNNKILNSNIVVEPIPSSYKNLLTTTTATANTILSGYTAYTNDGTLVTGNLSTTCVSGSYMKPANTHINIDLGFTPSKYFIQWYLSDTNDRVTITYNKDLSIKTFLTNNTVSYSDASSEFIVNNNKITDVGDTGLRRYTYNLMIYYMACK